MLGFTFSFLKNNALFTVRSLDCEAEWRNGNIWVFVVDVISTMEFDQEGKYLAVGDQGGRIVLFESCNSAKNVSATNILTSFLTLTIMASIYL